MLFITLLACTAGDEPQDTADPLADCPVRDFSTDATMDAVVLGNAAFGLDLYGELPQGNAFFSPLSISAAFGMTAAGTNNNTETELLEVLHVDIPEADWHSAFGALLTELEADRSDCGEQLAVANRLFGQQGYAWQSEFTALAADDYHAPLEDIDFIGDPEGSRTHINDWVEDQTEGRIEDLLPPNSINDGTRMVLANAIYFLADWQTQFDPEKTEQGEWRTTGAQVDLMHMEEVNFGLAYGDSYTALELPYGDGERSMVVYLPHEDDIGSLDLGPEDLVDISFQDQELTRLVLPRFELLDDTDLKEPMQSLGVLDAWEMGVADFSGLADIDLTQEPLFISGAFHKAFVAVDEAGTEAAAATAVVVGTESAGPEFVADRAFVFVIRDTRTRQVLFMGRLVEP